MSRPQLSTHAAKARSSTSSRSWKGSSKTVITATHQLEIVEDIASRVVVLEEGRLAASGSPAEILSNHELLLARQPGACPPALPRRGDALPSAFALAFQARTRALTAARQERACSPQYRNRYFTCTDTMRGSAQCEPPNVLLSSNWYRTFEMLVPERRTVKLSPKTFPHGEVERRVGG